MNYVHIPLNNEEFSEFVKRVIYLYESIRFAAPDGGKQMKHALLLCVLEIKPSNMTLETFWSKLIRETGSRKITKKNAKILKPKLLDMYPIVAETYTTVKLELTNNFSGAV